MYKAKILIPFLAISLLICNSCFKKPDAGFSYQPQKNPEAGDQINFYNESLEAITYYWDFGNGKTSEKENPSTIYDKPGDYTVTLFAENKFRSDSSSQTILIKRPTILDIYCWGTKGEALVSGWVRVWRSYEDALQAEDPLQSTITDAYGRARFLNLDGRTYFVYIRKEVEGGIFEGGGDVGPLQVNETNVYSALIQYFPGKKSTLEDEGSGRKYDTISFKMIEEERIESR